MSIRISVSAALFPLELGFGHACDESGEWGLNSGAEASEHKRPDRNDALPDGRPIAQAGDVWRQLWNVPACGLHAICIKQIMMSPNCSPSSRACCLGGVT